MTSPNIRLKAFHAVFATSYSIKIDIREPDTQNS